MAETLILFAHPDLRHSRVHARLRPALQALPAVDLHDLYARYPDYWIDVAAEQARAAAAQRRVFMHPIHWYGMPPLLKLWLDQVCTQGWAYGQGGRALAGKRFQLIVSTGGSPMAYSAQGHHGQPFEHFLAPYRQTAAFMGMAWEPHWVFHDAHRASEAELEVHIQALCRHLQEPML